MHFRIRGYLAIYTAILKFIKEPGRRIALHTSDPLDPSHLAQCLVVKMQIELGVLNSASILGTVSLLIDD